MKAVFFDVDFTLIYPGPTFRGEGYRMFGERYGLALEEERFDEGVASAAAVLETQGETYDAELFVGYAARIIEVMGGRGSRVEECAREVYREWAACRHFELYDDVADVFRDLTAAGLRLGLISNSHRSLASFEEHFELTGLIAAAVASSEHGYLKPHPSIFEAALEIAKVRPAEAVMVGDSLAQDVDGALGAGMRAVFLHRGHEPHPRAEELTSRGVPVLRSLRELPAALAVLG